MGSSPPRIVCNAPDGAVAEVAEAVALSFENGGDAEATLHRVTDLRRSGGVDCNVYAPVKSGRHANALIPMLVHAYAVTFIGDVLRKTLMSCDLLLSGASTDGDDARRLDVAS